MSEYSGMVSRSLSDLLGDTVSVLSYGAVGDGVTDDAPAFTNALIRLSLINGRKLHLPGGRIYNLCTPVQFPTGVLNICVQGDGASTLVTRGADMPAGKGVFDLETTKRVAFADFDFDGGTDVPTQLYYTDFAADPMHALLTLNSSFWIHKDCQDIEFYNVAVRHSGGYSHLIDARLGNISGITVQDSLFENNRPHTFGTTAGLLENGSWTGGVHWQSDGTSYAVENMTVKGNRWSRVTGNCVWGHCYALDRLNRNININDNHFWDTGLDGIMVGGVVGGSVSGNKFRRIGYITLTDGDTPVPRYPGYTYAVGLDTAGLVRGVNYTDNQFQSCNGACMDLDGYAEGIVSNNNCKHPEVGSDEYTLDSIATSGPGAVGTNATYGAQVSNSNNDATAGTNVTVEGNTFNNMGGGAVRMYASRRCVVRANTIIHPATAAVGPIRLGNIGTGTNQRSYSNVVTKNTIYYSPATPVAAVQEDSSIGAFDPTDTNYVSDNTLIGLNVYEFYKDSLTASTTKSVMSSAKTGLITASETVVQREDLYTRWYTKMGAVYSGFTLITPETTTSAMTMMDQVTLTGGVLGGTLLNVSRGAGVGGVITTAGRTSSAFDDAILSGKIYADGFFALGGATYNDTEANLLSNAVWLLRYNTTTHQPEHSTSTLTGSRVWTPLIASAVAAGATTEVQYNSAGLFAASSSFVWDNTLKLLTVTGLTGTPSIVAATSYIQANEGFYTPHTSSASIGAPNGGVTALSLISVRNDGSPGLYLVRNSGANQRTYGAGVNGSGQFILRDETAAAVRLTMTTAGNIGIGDATIAKGRLSVSGSNGYVYTGFNVRCVTKFSADANGAILLATEGYANTSGYTRGLQWGYLAEDLGFVRYKDDESIAPSTDLYISTAGVVHVNSIVDDGTGAKLQITGFASATVGYYTPSTSYQGIQAPLGGMYARSLHADKYFQLSGSSGVPTATSGTTVPANGVFYYDTALSKFRAYEGGSWKDMITAVTGVVVSVTGTTNQVVVTGTTSVVLSLPQNIHTGASPSFAALQAAGLITAASVDIGGTSYGATLDLTGNLYLVHNVNSTVALLVRGASGQIANLQEWRDFAGTAIAAVDASGNFYAPAYAARTDTATSSITESKMAARQLRFRQSSGDETNAGSLDYRNILSSSLSIIGAGTTTSNRLVQLYDYLTVNGVAGQSSLTITNGYVASSEGFYTAATAVNAVNIPVGGVTARYLVGTRSLTMVAETAANAGLSSAGQGRLYFDSVANAFKVSENGGAYLPLLSTSSVAGSSGQVQFNNAGAFGADSQFHWDNSAKFLGVGGTPSFQVDIQTNQDAVARQLVVRNSSAGTSAFSLLNFGNNVSSTAVDFGVLGSNNASYGGSGSSLYQANTGNMRLGTSAAYVLELMTNGSVRMYITSAGNVLIGTGTDDASGANLQVAGFLSATSGYYTVSSATDAFKALSGGVTARFLIGTRSLTMTAETAANAGLSASTQGRLYFDNVSNKFRVSEHGGAYVDLVSAASGVTSLNSLTGALSVVGTSNQITVSPAGASVTLSLPSQVVIAGSGSGSPGLTVSVGYVDAANGFYSAVASTEALKLTYGGISARSVNIYNAGGGGAYTEVINSSGQFVGNGISTESSGIGGAGFSVWNAGTLSYYTGQTQTSMQIVTDMRDNVGTIEKKTRILDIRGGVITSIGSESAWTAI